MQNNSQSKYIYICLDNIIFMLTMKLYLQYINYKQLSTINRSNYELIREIIKM